MSESKLQAKIIKWLESKGYIVDKIVTATKAGTADILACSPSGRYIAVEVKFGKNTLSAIQEYKLKLINQSGGVGITAWTLEEVQQQLKDAGEKYI